jgi:hypothetical protein
MLKQSINQQLMDHLKGKRTGESAEQQGAISFLLPQEPLLLLEK